MEHRLMQHVPLSFSLILGMYIREARQSEVALILGRYHEVAEDSAQPPPFAAAVFADAEELAVAVDTDTEIAVELWIYSLCARMMDIAIERAAPHDMARVVPLLQYFAEAPFEVFACPVRHPAMMMLYQSQPVLDHRKPGYFVVEAVENLTWAEKDMPWSEQRRSPLWPNSGREKTWPGLDFLGVHRVI
jgi:hypothetical protein